MINKNSKVIISDVIEKDELGDIANLIPVPSGFGNFILVKFEGIRSELVVSSDDEAVVLLAVKLFCRFTDEFNCSLPEAKELLFNACLEDEEFRGAYCYLNGLKKNNNKDK